MQHTYIAYGPSANSEITKRDFLYGEMGENYYYYQLRHEGNGSINNCIDEDMLGNSPN